MRLLKGGRWPYDAEMTTVAWRGPQIPEAFNPPQGLRFAADVGMVREALAARKATAKGESK